MLEECDHDNYDRPATKVFEVGNLIYSCERGPLNFEKHKVTLSSASKRSLSFSKQCSCLRSKSKWHHFLPFFGQSFLEVVFYISILSILLFYFAKLHDGSFPENICASFILLMLMTRFLIYSYQSHKVIEESIVLIPCLGVQLETLHYWGNVKCIFIPFHNISSFLINEMVTPSNCYFYLAFVLKNEENLILPFKALRPRLKLLIPIQNSVSKHFSKFNYNFDSN